VPLKNIHLPGLKFTGSFTELDKSLDANNNPLPGFEPYNQSDKIAMQIAIAMILIIEKLTMK